jgi:UDP-N-acetylglucosamine/UDP-N-acetylgalactosamine diphosphorylase
MEPTLGANVISQKMEELKALWAKHGQDHVFNWADSLNEQERITFLEDLQQVDVSEINKIYTETVAYEGKHTALSFYRHDLTCTTEANKDKKVDLKPFPNVTKFSDASKEQRVRWEQIGHGLLADNKVAILLLAGGQASRLGCAFPKGMFGILTRNFSNFHIMHAKITLTHKDIGLPSGKSLYQIQVERAVRMQKMAARSRGKGKHFFHSLPPFFYITI